jgi:hypothetical protein
LDHVLEGHVPAAVFERDRDHEGQARLDDALARAAIARTPTVGERELFVERKRLEVG